MALPKLFNSSFNKWRLYGGNGTFREETVLNTDYTADPTPYYGSGWNNWYDDDTYLTSDIHEEFLKSIHHHTSNFAKFLCVWTVCVNVFIVLSCTCKKELRHNGFYNQIVNLSISNILISTFVIPLTIYHIESSWNLGQALCKIYVIADVLFPFASIVIILLLNVDRIMSINHPRLYSWIFQKSMKSVIICTPWFTALVVVIPIWTSGTMPYNNAPGECIVIISKESAILCPLMTFFIPLAILITLTFKLLLLNIQVTTASTKTDENTNLSMKISKSQQREIEVENSEFLNTPVHVPSTRPGIDKEHKDDIVALCAVNISFAIMWFPFQCISFLLSLCHSQSCIPSVGLNQVVTWLGASSAGVVPLFWFIDSQVRTGLRAKCIRKPHVDRIESSHSEETFL